LTDDLEDVLRIMGLRKYEVAVYVTLMRNGPLAAKEVADIAKIPNPRIYSILDTLKKSGYVNELNSKPSLYDVQHPRYILDTELSNLRKRVNLALERAEQEYEMRKDQRLIETQDSWTTCGEKGLMAEFLRLVQTAKKEFFSAIHDLDWCLEEDTIKLLKNKKENHVQIKIIGVNPIAMKETADIFMLASGGHVKFIDKRDFSPLFAVIDGEEVLISLKKTAMTERDDYVSVAMRSKGVANLYRQYFDELWKEIGMEEAGR